MTKKTRVIGLESGKSSYKYFGGTPAGGNPAGGGLTTGNGRDDTRGLIGRIAVIFRSGRS